MAGKHPPPSQGGGEAHEKGPGPELGGRGPRGGVEKDDRELNDPRAGGPIVTLTADGVGGGDDVLLGVESSASGG